MAAFLVLLPAASTAVRFPSFVPARVHTSYRGGGTGYKRQQWWSYSRIESLDNEFTYYKSIAHLSARSAGISSKNEPDREQLGCCRVPCQSRTVGTSVGMLCSSRETTSSYTEGGGEIERCTGPHTTVFELSCDGCSEDVAMNGNLHHLLRDGLDMGETATMTDRGFLVVNHRSSEISSGSSKHRVSRLDLGNRVWVVDAESMTKGGKSSGVEVLEETPHRSTAISSSGGESILSLQKTIKTVVPIISVSEIFSIVIESSLRSRTNQKSATIMDNVLQSIGRVIARVRATRALATTMTELTPHDVSIENPLLHVGVGEFLSAEACDSIVYEAQKLDKWTPWDGDLGEGWSAVRLHQLPDSCIHWNGILGESIRSRIARLYGIQPSCLVADAENIFVCRGIFSEGSGTDEKPLRSENRMSLSARFRRSSSLITFTVSIIPEHPRWAVCLEQPEECIRLVRQGTGVVFSGKVRHAVVGMPRQSLETKEGKPTMILRGFATICHPLVREEVARWRWGDPAWHIDAPWIKDEDILDRAWAGPVLDSNVQAEHPPGVQGEGEVQEHLSGVESKPWDGISGLPVHQPLQRMNTTMAHRYYRQDKEGMNFQVLDQRGRPVIDLIPKRSSWFSREGQTEMMISAVLRRRFPWGRRRQVGKSGYSTSAGISATMDGALRELFADELTTHECLVRVPVPPIKYVFVDPRFRGLRLGRRLLLEAMCLLAKRGFTYTVIVVEDNGTGNLFPFYEEMGFKKAEEQLGIPRAMIAPIPPPREVLER